MGFKNQPTKITNFFNIMAEREEIRQLHYYKQKVSMNKSCLRARGHWNWRGVHESRVPVPWDF